MKLMNMKLMVTCGVLLLPGLSFGGDYRDKHGNAGTITFEAAIVNLATGGIDYTVPYTLTDSEAIKAGEFTITSQMLPGRDAPNSDDFVLNVLVKDNATANAAELVIRNNPNVAPLAPILRLLDCSSSSCTEVKVINNPEWGNFVIQDASDLATYPIELLDARVIIQLLEDAELSQLPNSADGTGNWAEIMENHRTNFQEAKFRMDIDFLGVPQSDFLTMRLIEELEDKRGGPDDWLVRHCPSLPCGSPGITHGALTFLTEHTELIEAMTTVLHNTIIWPTNFTFPFGRMPIWLVDPNLDAGPDTPGAVDPFHVLPDNWDRVIMGEDPLLNNGCYHDYPVQAYVDNIGQFVCLPDTTPNGFIDRPCTDPADYNGIGPFVEGIWHNPIHGFVGGAFLPATLTSGTAVFWAFHTYASSHTLVNWRHAQIRDMPTPISNNPPVAQCMDTTVPTDPTVCFATVASVDNGSFDPDGDPITLEQIPASPYALGMTDVTLVVTDDLGAMDSCEAKVTVVDQEPPMVLCNAPSMIIPPDAPISFTASATDNCLAETGVTTVITSFDCFKFTKKGKRIDKTESCEVAFGGDTVTIWDSGGVGDHITWTVQATDGSGNQTTDVCEVLVVNPGKGKKP